MNPNYDVDYFIRKFEAIPDGRWRVGDYGIAGEPRCVLGHCGEGRKPFWTSTAESEALRTLLGTVRSSDGKGSGPAAVNDGLARGYRQRTPKARILAALRDAKDGKLVTS